MLNHDADRDINREGYQLIQGVFAPVEISQLIMELPPMDGRAGTRSLLEYEVGKRCADDPRIQRLVKYALGGPATAVRGILFDKTPSANWVLGWHQDRKIAVQERIDVPGYSGWTIKEGVVHCQPPVHILESCVAVRIHLDDCGEEKGPLRVIPGSHRKGFGGEVDESQAVTLTCNAGDVILMKPLTLHASSKSSSPDHRRIIHIEYCSAQLDGGLQWATWVK
ncbi:MAG: phytanoyl-CoA dioxygenase family protein [Armatimonadetes bacterium]|nr:phytanoyl-CoA dioxygenase family protein [Armatimonadota bacterium]